MSRKSAQVLTPPDVNRCQAEKSNEIRCGTNASGVSGAAVTSVDTRADMPLRACVRRCVPAARGRSTNSCSLTRTGVHSRMPPNRSRQAVDRWRGQDV